MRLKLLSMRPMERPGSLPEKLPAALPARDVPGMANGDRATVALPSARAPGKTPVMHSNSGQNRSSHRGKSPGRRLAATRRSPARWFRAAARP